MQTRHGDKMRYSCGGKRGRDTLWKLRLVAYQKRGCKCAALTRNKALDCLFDIGAQRKEVIAGWPALRPGYGYISPRVSARKDIFGQVVIPRTAGLAEVVELKLALDSVIGLKAEARF